jgi:hypothetical protein
MSELQPTVNDLLAPRDELLDLIEGEPPRAKFWLLTEAQQDPHFQDAIKTNGLLQALANGLIALAHGEPLNAKKPPTPPQLWLPHKEFDPLMDGGDYIIEYGGLVSTRSMSIRLLHGAHKAIELAESYRRYNIGARGFYIDEVNRRIGLFSSGNTKFHQLDPPYCAERANFDKATYYGFTKNVGARCVALDIMGKPQYDEDSHKMPSTPHPCGNCREELYTNPIVDEDTLILSGNVDNGRHEEFTVPELLHYHGDILQ